MKVSDQVRVYSHGDESQAAIGTVVLLSANGRSIAVGFGDKPAFAITKGGVAYHPDHGVMLLATREEIDGKPWGPWVEAFGGGHYEIEEI